VPNSQRTVDSLCSFGTDRIENIFKQFYFFITWVSRGQHREHHSFVAVYGRYLATAVVYRAITEQRVCMLQYNDCAVKGQ
jgi:hypothetical protein